jgi:hypothetical protein
MITPHPPTTSEVVSLRQFVAKLKKRKVRREAKIEAASAPRVFPKAKPKRKTVAQRIKAEVDKVHAAYGETWAEIERLKRLVAEYHSDHERYKEFATDLGNGKLDTSKSYICQPSVEYVDFDKVNAIVREQIKTGKPCWATRT